MTVLASSRSSAFSAAVILGLLVIHAALLLDAARRNFVTCNEVGHVVAGISHLQTGTFSMYRVNPPLARMLAAYPVLLAEPKMDYGRLQDAPTARPEWPVSQDFLAANADRFFDLIQLARLSGILWSLVGGWLIYSWTRELFGHVAGCLSLALWCFCPLILAFAPLVVPDVPATVSCLAASYAFWHFLRKPSWAAASLVGVLLGVAELTKFTNLILYGVWPVLWLAQRFGERPSPQPFAPVRTQAFQASLIFLLSLLVINFGYGFQGCGQALRDFEFVSSTFTGKPIDSMSERPSQLGNRFRDRWFGRAIVPIPEQYLRGIDAQLHDLEAVRACYLRGQWRYPGWWYYYLYGLGVKLPLGLLGLFAWALFLSCTRNHSSASLMDEITLWLPAVAILVLVSAHTEFDHHLRYVLPVLPFMLISTGKLAHFLRPERWKMALVVLLLLAWSATSTVAVRPNYLAYFNEAAGGPRHGHDHLLGSNIDWGQDLFELKAWLDKHPEARPLGLAYCNFVDPRIIGIDYALPPVGLAEDFPGAIEDAQGLGPQPGYYAVSVNLVRGMNFLVPDSNGGWRSVPLHGYEYFYRFQPIAKAGYSIFIYRISLEEANAVRKELGLPVLRPHPPGIQPGLR